MGHQVSDLTIIYTDRSRIETGEHCLRKRYWNFHYEGQGIDRVGLKLDAEIGSATHLGVEYLLHGKSANEAASFAREYLRGVFEEARVDLGALTEGDRGLYQEAPELAEALVRAWATVRLPFYLKEYEVLW